MKKGLIIFVLIIAAGLGVYWLALRPSSEPAAPAENNQPAGDIQSGGDVQSNDGQSSENSGEADVSGQQKIVSVEAVSFSFSPAEIRVKKGDQVKIVLENKEGFHDWTLDEFNAKTERINGGETTSVEFVADKVGTFEYYCSVGNHRQLGMKGNLVVEE